MFFLIPIPLFLLIGIVILLVTVGQSENARQAVNWIIFLLALVLVTVLILLHLVFGWPGWLVPLVLLGLGLAAWWNNVRGTTTSGETVAGNSFHASQLSPEERSAPTLGTAEGRCMSCRQMVTFNVKKVIDYEGRKFARGECPYCPELVVKELALDPHWPEGQPESHPSMKGDES